MTEQKTVSTAKTITEEEIRALGAYEITEHRFLPDINSDSYVLRHQKTGARIAILPNADSNKVFYIGFRTPPKDSTGVAHIIEHTVLCGSRDFPVKDPFIEVVKGSLNTFLNAMTYPDKTVYPVASTNEKDFDNLMHVYLDAVFHPNIYTEENIFRQEGWHYEAVADENGNFDDNSPITVNGVVYNEMKGVMSSPDDVLNDKILASLYPDTTYSIVSGGDPEAIPQLTYENYLDFHRRYYHPSNSYIYLYGDMDMAERLRYLDSEYLSRYEELQVDSEIKAEPAFSAPREEEYPYSVMEGEDTKGKTYLSLNYHIPVEGNAKDNLGFKILDYILCDAEGAPVKEALRKKGIGQDVSSLYDSGIMQPYYSITAKYADREQKEEFLATIRETLEHLAQNGLDEKSILAGINYYEFHYREADFGSYPKGLVFGLDVLDTWLYDDKAVWTNLDIACYFDEIKEAAKNGYFEGLIRRYLLENPHKSIVMLTPEPGLTQRRDAALKAQMAEFAASLSPEERHAITEETAALRRWQETPDTKEALDTIPVLERKDLDRKALPYLNVEKTTGDLKVLAHPIFTSDIDYMTLLFDISKLPARLFPYLGIFKTLFGVLATEHYSYAELDHEINIVTGGIGANVGTYTDAKDTEHYLVTFEVNAKAMHGNVKEAIALIREILTATRYDDTTRIREVLEEERSGMRADLPASGHVTAITRATAYFSATSEIMDEVNGIGDYRLLDEICSNFDEEGSALPDILTEIAEFIFRKENLLFDITTDEEKIDEVLPVAEDFAGKLFGSEELPLSAEAAVDGAADTPYVPECVKRNEGFTTAGQVQYVCRAGNFLDKGYVYTGALRVLKVIMGYDYLWQRIRVKGGAYGCMSGFAKDGTAYFATYRDPHLSSSIDVFEQAGEYIRHFEADEKTMTKYVIGTVSGLDRPLSPHMYGRYSLAGYLTNYSDADMQAERDEVLDATVEDIRKLGDLVDAIMKDDVICVVGSSEKLEAAKEMFGTIEPLC
ncbi:hypothetical protein SAMN02745687_01087 [Lachnospiraceae bacterium NK3A20]|nr:hypothetical protein SAMN02745687_01087 [Lachnospiraceae bacterium NK3A20]